jgi:hypothetical protein
MKKLLMGTSAIALVGALSTTASAAEWDVKVGGFMTQHVGAALGVEIDNVSGEDYDGVDVLSNTEIIFQPSITLDNGIRFGANVQLEGNTSGDQIDESYMFIRGSFGEINIGSENSAGYKMTYAAPNVTAMPINSGSISAYIPVSGGSGVTGATGLFRNAKGSSFIEVGANNDAQRITYYTPRIAGFQLGASYARDPLQDSSEAVDLNGAALGDIFDVGANYVNSFGDFDVAVSARWGIGSDDRPGADDPEVMAFGANLGFAGFTVGYAFAESNNSGVLDSQSHSAGVSYETGPWGFSIEYFRGEGVDAENPFAVSPGGGSANDEVYQALLGGVSYALAKGVGLSAYVGYAETDEDTSDSGALGGDDVEGWVIGTAVALSF